jgi:hypothetical protein
MPGVVANGSPTQRQQPNHGGQQTHPSQDTKPRGKHTASSRPLYCGGNTHTTHTHTHTHTHHTGSSTAPSSKPRGHHTASSYAPPLPWGDTYTHTHTASSHAPSSSSVTSTRRPFLMMIWCARCPAPTTDTGFATAATGRNCASIFLWCVQEAQTHTARQPTTS